jgi:Protein of unknown function (DUF3124)
MVLSFSSALTAHRATNIEVDVRRGANVLSCWDGRANVDEPLIAAVMFGRTGNAGVSFTSRGQVVKSSSRE